MLELQEQEYRDHCEFIFNQCKPEVELLTKFGYECSLELEEPKPFKIGKMYHTLSEFQQFCVGFRFGYNNGFSEGTHKTLRETIFDPTP